MKNVITITKYQRELSVWLSILRLTMFVESLF